jgi:hypothetical protein
MSTQVQFRRGTAAENNAFTGALAEVTVNTTDNTLRVHDGSTTGGFTIVGLTATQTLTNKTLTSPVLTTPNIGVATGTSVSVTGAVNAATTMSATGNITGGNINTAGTITSTGNIVTSGYFVGNFTGTNVSFANVTLGNIINVNSSGTGNIGNSTGYFNSGFFQNLTGFTSATGNTISVTGNVSAGNAIVAGSISVNSSGLPSAIINTGSNGAGNIGSSTTYFNTIFAKATSAQYADLAEMYVSDTTYTPGTVLIFGGDNEVTANVTSHSTAVAGVVSKNPSHLMNSGLQGEHVVAVALLGRVPCQVQGTIRKGDLLVCSSTPGTATRLDPALYQPGCVIGKSLENYDSDSVGMIEIAVGVK